MSYYSQIESLSPNVWFKFNETTGTPANSGSTTCTLTALGSPTLNQSSALYDKSIYLNGTNAGYKLSDFSQNTIFDDQSFTIETWFRTPAISTGDDYRTFFGARSNLDAATIRLRMLNTSGSLGKIEARIGESSTTSSTLTTTARYDDDKWHHLVWAVNTTSQKLYIDGTEVATASTDISSIPDSFDRARGSGGTDKTIGQYYRANATAIGFYKGYLDEFTLYNYQLSAQNVADNYAAGATVNYTATVTTASALMVDSTISTEAINSVSVMTASAEFGEHHVSNFNYYTGLDAYLDTLTLEERFKFNAKAEKTIGTNDSQIPLEFYSGAESFYGLGPDGTGALRVGSYTGNGYGRFGLTDGLSDKDFTFGIWFKLDSNSPTDGIKKYIISTTPRLTGNAIMDISHTDGEITFAYKTSSSTISHTVNTDYRDNLWHLASIRCDGSTLKYFIDGVQEHSQSAGGTRTDIIGMFFGTAANLDGGASGDSTYIYLAAPFISTSSNVQNGTLSSIYDAGNHKVQGGALINEVTVKFNNALDDYTEANGARADIRFNESIGNPANFGVDQQYFVLYETAGVIKDYPSKNKSAYSYQDPGDFTETAFDYIDVENDTSTHTIVAKLGAPDTGEVHIFGMSVGDFDTNLGVVFGFDEDGPWAGVADASFDLGGIDLVHSNDVSWFDKWAMYTVVKDGSDIDFYINGQHIGSNTTAIVLSPYGESIFGGVENYLFGQSNVQLDAIIDEYKVFNYAMTSQQQFEMWQKMQIDGWDPANGEFVAPSIIAGTGHEFTLLDSLDAYAEFVDPIEEDEINPTIEPMTAFGAFMHPNFEGTANVDIAADPMNVNADFENPSYQIGEFIGAETLHASAEMLEAYVRIPGFWNAAPMSGTFAEMVDPGLATTLGALINATPMTAKASLPLPPAYKQLIDDLWYALLYNQHQPRHTAQYGGATLKLFDDVTSTISLSTTAANRYITNNLSPAVILNSNSTTTSVTKIFASDNLTLSDYVKGANLYNPSNNLPLLEPGYYDDFNRKAVLLNNIQFDYVDEAGFKVPYSTEFFIKTDKADQIIAQNKWASNIGYQQSVTSYGLSDGKFFVYSKSFIGTLRADVHPKNYANLPAGSVGINLIGNKAINDGFWHHIVIQNGWEDNRIQIWIDGQLDIQRIGVNNIGQPTYLGYNSNSITYAPNFFISAWSYDSNNFISERDIDLHYNALINYEPIKAEPMYATTDMFAAKAAGNRGRALMLYFWPTNLDGYYVNPTPSNIYSTLNDQGNNGYFDVDTFDKLRTWDQLELPPQQYFDWDIYPVDINGQWVSELVNKDAYGTIEQYQLQKNRNVLINKSGYFRDPITDDRRYIDLINDIDLSQFDAIFFRNYPDQSNELDRYARNEYVDTYFNIRESKIFEDFLKSLRAAVDTGLSLMITNSQLAMDLGIIEGYEEVPDMDDLYIFQRKNNQFTDTGESDSYTPTLVWNAKTATGAAYWTDGYKNNKFRVVNTLNGLTDDEGFIWTDTALYIHDPNTDFGGSDLPYNRYEYKNGLSVGDQFVISDFTPNMPVNYEAVPFDKVKAGTIITAFANQIRRGSTVIDNPYKNYATSIAVMPGDYLNGKQLGGKIFVNFTERLSKSAYGTAAGILDSTDHGQVDLSTDYWIDIAYNDGAITAEERTALLAGTLSAPNLDRRLENSEITQDQYNKESFWSSNGNNIVSSKQTINDPLGGGKTTGKRTETVIKTKKSGDPTTGKVTSDAQWFTFEYSRKYKTMQIKVPSMITRGFRWLSERIFDEGTVVRVGAMYATAELPNPAAVIDRDIEITASVMISVGNMTFPTNYTQGTALLAVAPFTANAEITQWVFNQNASVMLASASMRPNTRVITSAVDEIVVYLHHTDPILYIREDVIK